jgi:hypothetical protein
MVNPGKEGCLEDGDALTGLVDPEQGCPSIHDEESGYTQSRKVA